MEETIFDLSAAAADARAMNLERMFVIVVVLFSLFIFVALAFVIRRLLTRPDLHGMSRADIAKRWAEIEAVAEQGLMGAKMAVVEADKLLDGALKSMMMPGETLGERLRVAGYKYPELRHVWFAHKLRNQLVHETTFELTPSQAKAAIHEYKKALKTLNVI
jgi:hypothetical protein